MFDKDGNLDERSQRILAEQTIPPRYGRSPGMVVTEAIHNEIIARLDHLPADEAATTLTVQDIQRAKDWLKRLDED